MEVSRGEKPTNDPNFELSLCQFRVNVIKRTARGKLHNHEKPDNKPYYRHLPRPDPLTQAEPVWQPNRKPGIAIAPEKLINVRKQKNR